MAGSSGSGTMGTRSPMAGSSGGGGGNMVTRSPKARSSGGGGGTMGTRSPMAGSSGGGGGNMVTRSPMAGSSGGSSTMGTKMIGLTRSIKNTGFKIPWKVINQNKLIQFCPLGLE